MRIFIVAIILFALTGIALMFVPVGVDEAPVREVEMGVYGSVAPFEFIDQSGGAYASGNLEGKVWLANFVFTSCVAECPILSRRVAEVRRNLEGHDDVGFISFSVDPQTDTPERLARFSEPYGQDDRWKLLTGDPEKLDTLIKKDFLLPVASDYQERRDIAQAGFLHSNKLIVVDRQGVIRYYSDGLEAESVDGVTRIMEILLHQET